MSDYVYNNLLRNIIDEFKQKDLDNIKYEFSLKMILLKPENHLYTVEISMKLISPYRRFYVHKKTSPVKQSGIN